MQQNGARVDIPTRAAQALLAYLLLPAGEAHRRELLAGLLWPESPEPNALRSLRQALWQLRGPLERVGAKLVEADRLTVMVNPAVLDRLDVARLQAPVSAWPSVAELSERVDAYGGELLPGFYHEWLVVERERLQSIFEQRITQLLETLESEQRWREVLERGQRWIGLGHVPEPAYQAVMRAYAALGDPASAAQTYARCCEALQQRLGLEPSELTHALYTHLSRPSAGMAPAPANTDLAEQAAQAAGPGPLDSPYMGLQPFDETHTHLFFGRERLVERLLNYLRTHTFLAVVGASGSGKSSLVRAGLAPALRGAVAGGLEGAGSLPHGAPWRVDVLTPGRSPLEALAAAVAGAGASDTAVAAMAVDLLRGPEALHLFAQAALDEPGPGPERLLLVDQFEELFTLCRDETVRRAFIGNLLYAATPAVGRPLHVVITLRADFYAHCANYAGLRQALESQQNYMGPMSAVELRRAIELPAQHAGLMLQSGLVEVILRDVGAEPGALPLLSHALLETWKRRRGRLLALAGYAEAGGVRGAIARTAEHVFQRLSAEQQALARRIFLRLTELGEGNQATRRRAALAELRAESGPGQPVEAVLQVLADARLIIIGADGVEVAHEALIREWPTLRQWLNEDYEGLRLHRRLTEAAQAWAGLDRNEDELYRGARLAQAHEWALVHPDALNALEAEFLVEADALVQRALAEREAQQQRELEAARLLAEAEKQRAEQTSQSARRLRFAAGVLFGAFVLVMGLAALAFGLAEQRQAAVEVAQANLTTSNAQRLAAEADALLQSGGDAQLTALLAIRSITLEYSPEADAVLGAAVALNLPTLRLIGHTNSLRDATYSPDGQYIVTAANDGTARLWRTDTGAEVRKFLGHGGALTSVAYAADGRWVLTGGEDGLACLWDAGTGALIRRFEGHAGQVQSVDISVDGQWVVTAATDDTVRVWELASGAPAGAVLTVAAETVALSPDGKLVLTGNRDGLAQLWDWQSGQLVQNLAGHHNRLIAVAFAPDGRLAVTGGVDKVVRIWDIATGQPVQVLAGHTGSVFGVAFSPDGLKLVTSGEDRTARLWDVTTGVELGQFYGHSATVTDLAFAPDGRHIVTAGADGLGLVWDTQPEGPVHVLAGHGGQIWNALFSPDGRYLLTASVDQTARLWDIRTGETVQQFVGHTAELFGLAYSSDGRWVVTASFDGTARLWEAATGTEVRQFHSATGQVMAGAAISPDGRFVAASDEGGLAYIWDAQTGALVRQLRGHTSGMNLMAYSPDGKVIATTNNDATARLWSADTGDLLHVLEGHTAFVVSVAFSPDGRYVATASGDSTARIWDVETGALVRLVTGHADLVWSVAYSFDGRYLATGSADGAARLWDAATGEEVRRFAGHAAAVQAVAVSPDGALLATASDDGTARLWDMDYQRVVTRLCGRLLRDLTPAEREQHGVEADGATCAGE